MARIIGGIGTSHVPTIAMAYDRKKQNDPDWAPLFKGYEPVARWMAERKPDVLVFFYNDHATTFLFDHYPDLRAGRKRRISDRRRRAGAAPGAAVEGPRTRSRATWPSRWSTTSSTSRCSRTCRSTTAAIRRSPCSGRPRPTGPGRSCRSRSTCCSTRCPTPLRCYKLGQAVRRAVESYPEDLKVVVVGTGGLSHQMNGERAGFNNTEWDMKLPRPHRARSGRADRG